jgi:hypothetical protein
LGERILAELGGSRTNDTLTRWLAHHTARLVQAADRAREAGDPDADARDEDARAAILQLWQARSAWPSGWPPPRAAEIARMLDALPDLDDPGWYDSTVLAQLHDLHHQVLAVLVDLATKGGGADIEQGWLDAFGDRLTADEAMLLRRAATRPRRLNGLLRWWARHTALKSDPDPNDRDADNAPSAAAAHPLIELADTYRNTILGLLHRTTEVTRGDDDRDANVGRHEGGTVVGDTPGTTEAAPPTEAR